MDEVDVLRACCEGMPSSLMPPGMLPCACIAEARPGAAPRPCCAAICALKADTSAWLIRLYRSPLLPPLPPMPPVAPPAAVEAPPGTLNECGKEDEEAVVGDGCVVTEDDPEGMLLCADDAPARAECGT
jgi:hypothetical protein